MSCTLNYIKNTAITQYINAAKLIYNQSNDFVSIVDDKGTVLYLSKSMHQLVVNNTSFLPKTINQYNIFSDTMIADIQNINQRVIQLGKMLRYIYIIKDTLDSDNFLLFHGKKFPICVSNKNVAILTINHKINLIDIENLTEPNPNNYYCKLPNYQLNDTEQLILFYASFYFSYGETFHFIIKRHDHKLQYENFKYYCKRLLKIFDTPTMKNLIANNNILKNHRFVPLKLLKTGFFPFNSDHTK